MKEIIFINFKRVQVYMNLIRNTKARNFNSPNPTFLDFFHLYMF